LLDSLFRKTFDILFC